MITAASLQMLADASAQPGPATNLVGTITRFAGSGIILVALAVGALQLAQALASGRATTEKISGAVWTIFVGAAAGGAVIVGGAMLPYMFGKDGATSASGNSSESPPPTPAAPSSGADNGYGIPAGPSQAPAPGDQNLGAGANWEVLGFVAAAALLSAAAIAAIYFVARTVRRRRAETKAAAKITTALFKEAAELRAALDAEYTAYEMDLADVTFDRPLLKDVSISQTAAFFTAHAAMQDAFTEYSSHSDKATAQGALDAARAARQAWDLASEHARSDAARQRRTMPSATRAKLDRARRLLDRAAHPNTTAAERESCMDTAAEILGSVRSTDTETEKYILVRNFAPIQKRRELASPTVRVAITAGRVDGEESRR